MGICLVVVGLVSMVVFNVWYPYPYREISGGRELFMILVAVDVVLGPLLTFAIFDRTKPRTSLRRDLWVVAAFQIVGLGYGLWTMFVARPVHLVFEIDRFRVIHAVDVSPDLLDKSPPGVEALPWTGPTLLSTRPFVDEREKMEATLAALQGVELGSRPDLWQPYPMARAAVLEKARPVSELKTRFIGRSAEIDAAVASADASGSSLMYLPLVGRKSFWTVLIEPPQARVVGFLPLDSF